MLNVLSVIVVVVVVTVKKFTPLKRRKISASLDCVALS